MNNSNKQHRFSYDSKLLGKQSPITLNFNIQSTQNYPIKPDLFRIGHGVKIILGECRELIGTIVGVDMFNRMALVEVELLGRLTKVIISYDYLELDQ